MANQHFGGTLAGTITLTGGLGGMGGAQPLAVTGNGGVALCVEIDPWRAQRRVDHRYLDEIADEHEGKLRVAKLNIDENQATPPKYGIRGIPTLMVFKGGAVAATKVGAAPKGQLQSWIEPLVTTAT